MSPANVARILVVVEVDGIVVHEYRRATTMLRPNSVPKMLEGAQGWLQAYASQATNEQLAADAARIRGRSDGGR